MDLDFLSPCFLGPNAENDQLLESILLEFIRDHCFWRRNFHPEDQRIISVARQHDREHLEFVARMKEELYRLSGDLKRAVPFFSPRYVGHMSSDVLLPGLIARLVTSLYNPNNVSEDAAPATLVKELEVGRQLARMFGMSTDDDVEPCAWGHLTSGGTVANYEALWNFRSLRFYPIALAAAARALDFEFDRVGPLDKALDEYTTWELSNLTVDAAIELRRACATKYRAQATHAEMRAFSSAVHAERIETLGTAGFFAKHRDLEPPVVLVSGAGHYSWEKGMKVLGLGTAQLRRIDLDANMRMDVDHFERVLESEFAARRPVLAAVGILGTTEFGTVDPIHRILEVRDRCRERGLEFGVHVDAAWGGYLSSLFRRPNGDLESREVLRQDYHYFPSAVVYDSFAALANVDSITVDPHKLGYVPYAAGAFVCRNREVIDFIAQRAAYVFDLGTSERERTTSEKLHSLGQYVLEGSKAGAAAASVYVTHRVFPLDRTGFGRLIEPTIRASEYFFDTWQERAEEIADRVIIRVPFEPDSNLVCLAVNPTGNRSLRAMNHFGRRLFRELAVEPERPVQDKEFIGSYTSVFKNTVAASQADRILKELGIDPATFVGDPVAENGEDDHIYLLRHTLMNPWLLHRDGEGRNFIDLYWQFLERTLSRLVASRDCADGE